MKTDIFNCILETVSEVCEVTEEDLLSQKRNGEILEARTILAWFCFDYGFSANDIKHYLHRKRASSVYAYRANYCIYKKVSTSFRIFVQQVSNILSNKIPATVS